MRNADKRHAYGLCSLVPKIFLCVAYLITVVSYGCFGLYGIIAGNCETDPLF